MKSEAPNTSQSGMCVVTVCVDQALAEKVRLAALREYGNFLGDLQYYSPGEGELQSLLKLRNAEASICIIDFDQDHERAVATANTIQQMLHGKAILIALSEKDEPALIREAMRAGCSEYLIKPVSSEALCESLTRLRGWLKSNDPAHKARGKTLAFLGCRGGAGTTTLAVHLAMFLSGPFGKRRRSSWTSTGNWDMWDSISAWIDQTMTFMSWCGMWEDWTGHCWKVLPPIMRADWTSYRLLVYWVGCPACPSMQSSARSTSWPRCTNTSSSICPMALTTLTC